MFVIKDIIAWIFDPKNRSLLVAALVAVLILWNLNTCNRLSGVKNDLEKEKKETLRVTNNFEASLDTLEQFRADNGNLIGQIQGYELTVDELNTKYSDLKGDYVDLKNRPPVTITEVVTVIKDSIIEVNVNGVGDSTGGNFAFRDSTFFTEGNFRNLSGNIPYDLDFNLDNPVRPGKGAFEITQSLSLSTFLSKDKESGKILINVETPYPGVTFSSIKGASILDDENNKKIWRESRKVWGLGFNVGYGVLINTQNSSFSTGPYFGVGLSYTPKWLQWGK